MSHPLGRVSVGWIILLSIFSPFIQLWDIIVSRPPKRQPYFDDDENSDG